MSTQSAPDLSHPQVEYALTNIFLFPNENVMSNFEFKKDCVSTTALNLALNSIVIIAGWMTGRKDFVLWYLRQFGVKRLRRDNTQNFPPAAGNPLHFYYRNLEKL